MKDFFARRGLGEAYNRLFHTHKDSETYRNHVRRFGMDCDVMNAEYLRATGTCPHCSSEMAPMGLDFKAPRRDDREAWTIVQKLYENGFAFSGCGCSVGYKPPENLAGMADFFASHRRKRSEGEKLLASISQRSPE